MSSLLFFLAMLLLLALPMDALLVTELEVPSLIAAIICILGGGIISFSCITDRRITAIAGTCIPIYILKLIKTYIHLAIKYFVEVGPRASAERNRKILFEFLECDANYSKSVTMGYINSIQETNSVIMIRKINNIMDGIPDFFKSILGGGVSVAATLNTHNISIPSKSTEIYNSFVRDWDIYIFNSTPWVWWFGCISTIISLFLVVINNTNDYLAFHSKELKPRNLTLITILMSILSGSFTYLNAVFRIYEDRHVYAALKNVSDGLVHS